MSKMSAMCQSKQQIVAKFRQSAILDAARRVFARKGFDAALVGDIAAEAGIAKGTVYLYFKSKAGIYSAALREDLAALAALKRQGMAAADSPRDKLLAFFNATIEYCDRRRDFFRIFLLESGRIGSALAHTPNEVLEHKAEQVKTLAALFTEQARRGEIRPVAPERAAALIGDAVRGIIERRLLESANPPAHQDACAIVDLLWNGLKPEEALPAKRMRRRAR